MAEMSPVARSPIAPRAPEVVVAGWSVSGRRSTASLTLTDCTPLAKVAAKAPWDGPMTEILGVPFGRAARKRCDLGASTADLLITGSGPGEWLLLAAPDQSDLVVDWVEKTAEPVDGLVTVVDLTHGRAMVRLTGPMAPDLLAKECAVDLDDRICPQGAALRTAVAGVATDLVRDDVNGTRSYLLHCERSSGQYLFDSLLDSGAEFGVDVDGFMPPGI